MTEILHLNRDFDSVRNRLAEGQVGIYPIKHAYMLVAKVERSDKLREIKGKTTRKPLVCVFDSSDRIESYLELDEIDTKTWDIAQILLKLGVITVLPTPYFQDYRDPSNSTQGFYVPGTLSYGQALLENFPYPLVATSANLTGKNSPFSLQDIPPEITQKCQFLVDVGSLVPRSDLTIFNPATGNVLRRGEDHEIIVSELLYNYYQHT